MRNAIFKIIDLIGGYLNEDEDVKSLFSLGTSLYLYYTQPLPPLIQPYPTGFIAYTALYNPIQPYTAYTALHFIAYTALYSPMQNLRRTYTALPCSV